MRVAIDTTFAQLGRSGTAVYIERLIPALEAEGVEVVRLSAPLRRARGGRNKLRSAANAAIDLTWTRELLPRAARRAGADVIHHPLPAWSPGEAAQVLTVHDVAYATHPDHFDPLWRRIARRQHRAAVRRAGAVIAVSRTTARDAAAYLGAAPEKLVIAPHGPGQELAPATERAAEFFLYVGDDEPRKNVSALLAAHEEYLRRGGRAQLILAGAAARRAQRRGETPGDDWLRTGAAGDGARVVGFSEPDAELLSALHARAIALVHPSADEGFGLTVLEAMAAGTPVVSARNAAIEELTAGAALIVEPDELADALARLDDQDALRERLARAGRERAARFSWRASASAHIRAYTLAREHR